MDFSNLGKDRFLHRDPNQNDGTKGAVYTASNPAPKRGDDMFLKIGRPKGSEEDSGAPNILTGTVITSCFIQTSALPSRVELQGNDITFFDDTATQNGNVTGDTSRLIFTHGSGKKGEVISQGFILEKRASAYNTYDNVLSWYSPAPLQGAHNYMFVGRNGFGNEQRHLNSLHFSVNAESGFVSPAPDAGPLNGVYNFEYCEDSVFVSPLISMGNSQNILPGSPFAGYSSLMFAGAGGIAGFGYVTGPNAFAAPLYVTSASSVALGADLIPDTAGAYDIGSPSFKIGTLYGSVVACPLPTVEGSALEVLAKIEAPVLVGDRGHYGDGKYYDDLTFPDELLFTDSKGRKEIEHTKMIGFLLQTVIELRAEVDFLKSRA